MLNNEHQKKKKYRLAEDNSKIRRHRFDGDFLDPWRVAKKTWITFSLGLSLTIRLKFFRWFWSETFLLLSCGNCYFDCLDLTATVVLCQKSDFIYYPVFSGWEIWGRDLKSRPLALDRTCTRKGLRPLSRLLFPKETFVWKYLFLNFYLNYKTNLYLGPSDDF